MAYALFSAVGVVLACAGIGFTVSVDRPARRRPGSGRAKRLRRGGHVGPTPVRRLNAVPAVSVVIPALNEAKAIGWVLERIPEWVTEVILVDGRSADATEIVARDLVPDLVVVHQPQLGKGAALRAGFAAARGDIIAMLDADGSTDPAELARFVRALQSGADFVKGSRHLPGGGSEDFTRLRKGGNRAFVRLANLLYGCDFTDLCYGYCAFWRRTLPLLALAADGFEIESELVLRAVKAGLNVGEVPSVELCRRAGASNLNAVRDGWRVLWTIMAERGRSLRPPAMAQAKIMLLPVRVPAPGSPGWLPAGLDSDRRTLDRSASGYAGPERRHPRRQRPAVTVYRAVDQPAAVGSVPDREVVRAPEPIATEAATASQASA
jgi:Glycosyl transferase family 2